MQNERLAYVPEYDGLRGVMSTMVVVAHLHLPLAYWVWWTMDIFFCLSGFLLGSAALRGLRREGFIWAYFRGRALRIWPAYFACFAVTLLLVTHAPEFLFGTPHWPMERDVAQSFVFLQHAERWGVATASMSCAPGYIPFWCHTWSVALEEQFYLLVPVLAWLALRTRNALAWAAALALGVLVAGSLLREAGWHWWTLIARFDGFAVGLLLAVALPTLQRLDRAALLRLATLALTACAVGMAALYAEGSAADGIVHGHPVFSIGVSVAAAAAGCLILLIHLLRATAWFAWLRWGPFVFLGRMSYSTYLWHWPVLFIVAVAFRHWGVVGFWPLFLTQLVACYTVALAAHWLIERPFIALKQNLPSRPFPDALTRPV